MSETQTYKEFIIEITEQGKLGDNTEVFFRVLKGEETLFTHWQVTSGTESDRVRSRDLVVKRLVNDGVKEIKLLLDSEKYVKGGNYRQFSSFT